MTVEANAELLSSSEIVGGPGATDIGEPSFDSKSIWDEVNNNYNINKEEQDYEVHE